MQAHTASDSPRRGRRGRGAYLPDRLGSLLPASAQIGLRRRTPLTPETVLHPKSTAKVRYKRRPVLGVCSSAPLDSRKLRTSRGDPRYRCIETYRICPRLGRLLLPCRQGFSNRRSYRHTGHFDEKRPNRAFGSSSLNSRKNLCPNPKRKASPCRVSII